MRHWEDDQIHEQIFCLLVCFIINHLCKITLTFILVMWQNKPPDDLRYRCFLRLAFVFVEAAAGLFANSLALLTDAAHNFTDVIALGISWYAVQFNNPAF